MTEKELKDFIPTGIYVLIKVEKPKERKTKTGIVLMDGQEAPLQKAGGAMAFIEAFGDGVSEATKKNYAVGDAIVFNENDAKWIGRTDNENKYCLVREVSLMAKVPNPKRDWYD